MPAKPDYHALALSPSEYWDKIGRAGQGSISGLGNVALRGIPGQQKQNQDDEFRSLDKQLQEYLTKRQQQQQQEISSVIPLRTEQIDSASSTDTDDRLFYDMADRVRSATVAVSVPQRSTASHIALPPLPIALITQGTSSQVAEHAIQESLSNMQLAQQVGLPPDETAMSASKVTNNEHIQELYTDSGEDHGAVAQVAITGSTMDISGLEQSLVPLNVQVVQDAVIVDHVTQAYEDYQTYQRQAYNPSDARNTRGSMSGWYAQSLDPEVSYTTDLTLLQTNSVQELYSHNEKTAMQMENARMALETRISERIQQRFGGDIPTILRGRKLLGAYEQAICVPYADDFERGAEGVGPGQTFGDVAKYTYNPDDWNIQNPYYSLPEAVPQDPDLIAIPRLARSVRPETETTVYETYVDVHDPFAADINRKSKAGGFNSSDQRNYGPELIANLAKPNVETSGSRGAIHGAAGSWGIAARGVAAVHLRMLFERFAPDQASTHNIISVLSIYSKPHSVPQTTILESDTPPVLLYSALSFSSKLNLLSSETVPPAPVTAKGNSDVTKGTINVRKQDPQHQDRLFTLILALRKNYKLPSDPSLFHSYVKDATEIERSYEGTGIGYFYLPNDDNKPEQLAAVRQYLAETAEGRQLSQSPFFPFSWAAAILVSATPALARGTRLRLTAQELLSQHTVQNHLRRMPAISVFCAIAGLPVLHPLCLQYFNETDRENVIFNHNISESAALVSQNCMPSALVDAHKGVDKEKAIASPSMKIQAQHTIPRAKVKNLVLFTTITANLMTNGLLEAIVYTLIHSNYDGQIASTALPLLAKCLYAMNYTANVAHIKRFLAIRGIETLIDMLAARTGRADVFAWIAQCVTLLCQNPHNHSSGATARLVSEGFCEVFFEQWIHFSDKVHVKVGSLNHGEEFAAPSAVAAEANVMDVPSGTQPPTDDALIVCSYCFFVGCEALAAICGNTNVNSSMNSTHNKANIRYVTQSGKPLSVHIYLKILVFLYCLLL